MKKILSTLTMAIAIACCLISCSNSTNKVENQTYEESYNNDLPNEVSEVDSEYINNSLSTGDRTYECSGVYGNDSKIMVKTSPNSTCDLVAIIKKNGVMIDNAYITAGGSYTFELPNGKYQVFFYAGQGWNPNKVMANNLNGGFVANESYSKDEPISLEYQGLTYELIPQTNGNFSTKQSSPSEVF